eukprot:scaffold207_cov345-Pavlova_lutheri.AAC.35
MFQEDAIVHPRSARPWESHTASILACWLPSIPPSIGKGNGALAMGTGGWTWHPFPCTMSKRALVTVGTTKFDALIRCASRSVRRETPANTRGGG